MKITEITYSCGRTLQIKQFEPINVHFSAKAEFNSDGNMTLTQAYDCLKKFVDHEVDLKITELTKPSRVIRAASKIVLDKDQKKELMESISKMGPDQRGSGVLDTNDKPF